MMFFRKRERPVRPSARRVKVQTETWMWFRDTSMASRIVACRKRSWSCMFSKVTGSVAGKPASGSWQFRAPKRITPFSSSSFCESSSSLAHAPHTPVHVGASLAEEAVGGPPSHVATSFRHCFVVSRSKSGV